MANTGATTQGDSWPQTLTQFLVSIAGLVWKAFCFATLWNWFVVRLGAPEIGLALSIGLILTVAVLRRPTDDPDKASCNERMARTFWISCANGCILGVGWVVLQYLPAAA